MRYAIAIAVPVLLALVGRVGPVGTGPDGQPSPSTVPPIDLTITLGGPFTLGVHETAQLDGDLVIRFDTLVEDSRCPTNVQCVWEGNAEISLVAATIGQSPAVLALNSNPAFPTEADYGGYTIRLIGLEPYPRTDGEAHIPYRATLVTTLTMARGPTHLEP